jgi:hypothetical protein
MVTENEKLICLEYGEFFDGGEENNKRIRKLLGKRIYLRHIEDKLNDKMDGSARYHQRFIEKTDVGHVSEQTIKKYIEEQKNQ